MKHGTPDSCGCALGAKFMGVALLASGAYYGWLFSTDQASIGDLAAGVALFTFVAASGGKVIGIIRYRLRGKPLFRPTR